MEKFGDNIKILSTHNLVCWKFASAFRKIAIFYPAYFF